MSLSPLDNLVKIGQLKPEPMNDSEISGLIRAGQVRLEDAKNISMSLESRFDLAYNASHSLALAALRYKGYRSNNRYLAFQTLPHTLGLGPEVWRVLAKCHERRNLAEYEGGIEIEEQLMEDLITAAEILLKSVKRIVKKEKPLCN